MVAVAVEISWWWETVSSHELEQFHSSIRIYPLNWTISKTHFLAPSHYIYIRLHQYCCYIAKVQNYGWWLELSSRAKDERLWRRCIFISLITVVPSNLQITQYWRHFLYNTLSPRVIRLETTCYRIEWTNLSHVPDAIE